MAALPPSLAPFGLFWAKSEPSGTQWLSVPQHLLDVAGVITPVAQALVAPPVIEDFRQRLRAHHPALTPEVMFQFAALTHDLGKVSPFFQGKVAHLNRRVVEAGYVSDVSPTEMGKVHHSIVSAVATENWLRERRAQSAVQPSEPTVIRSNQWFTVLGGHHGYFPHSAVAPPGLRIEDERWASTRAALLTALAQHLAITDESLDALAWYRLTLADQILITGVLIAADWVGSNERNFSYVPLDQEPAWAEASKPSANTTAAPSAPTAASNTPSSSTAESFVQQQQARVAQGLAAADLGARWQPTAVTPETFAERFGLPPEATPNPTQRTAMELASAAQRPGMYLIEAETGSGKTEAALAMAMTLAQRFGRDGLYVAQPTRMTSDAMFHRVRTTLERTPGNQRVSTILAHGKAQFNEEYQGLMPHAEPQAIYDEEPQGTHAAGESFRALEAQSWFRGRKTSLLASVVVGTIDQLLLASLRTGHVVLRHLGLLGKVVIIDEIHAADTFMMEYLKRSLEWLGFHGVPVIGLSATLPQKISRQLLSAYEQGRNAGTNGPAQSGKASEVPAAESEAAGTYPRISFTNGTEMQQLFPGMRETKKHVEIAWLPGELSDVASAVLHEGQGGGCTAVICSTVQRAQDLYATVCNAAPSHGIAKDEIVLVHSRFLTVDRIERENSLVKMLGKDADARPGRVIVISTQVIEQGLDLDFDRMFSDVAPVDVLIQRMGRLHRHPLPASVRPANSKQPKFTIFGIDAQPSLQANPPEFPKGAEFIYGKFALLTTCLALLHHANAVGPMVTAPDHVATLIEEKEPKRHQVPQSWMPTLRAACVEERTKRGSQQQRARDFQLPQPREGAVDNWNKEKMGLSEQAGAAMVRDGDEGIEVIIVERRDGHLWALPHIAERFPQLCDVPLDEPDALTDEAARALAKCTLRLPAWAFGDSNAEEAVAQLEEVRPAAWQRSPWLRGQLPFFAMEFTNWVYHWELGFTPRSEEGR